MEERKPIDRWMIASLVLIALLAVLILSCGLFGYIRFASWRAAKLADAKAEADAAEERVRLQREKIRLMERENQALQQKIEDIERDIPGYSRHKRRELEQYRPAKPSLNPKTPRSYREMPDVPDEL